MTLRLTSVAWRASAARIVMGSRLFNWLISFFVGLVGRPLYGTYLVLPRLWGLSPSRTRRSGRGSCGSWAT